MLQKEERGWELEIHWIWWEGSEELWMSVVGGGGAVPMSVETKMLHRKVLAPVLLKVKGAQSRPTLCDPMDYTGPELSRPEHWSGGSLSFLRGIFPTQGLNSGLLHCRQILYQLSHKGSPKILEWVAYPFSRGSSWPRNQSGVSCITGRFFTNWAIREALSLRSPQWCWWRNAHGGQLHQCLLVTADSLISESKSSPCSHSSQLN